MSDLKLINMKMPRDLVDAIDAACDANAMDRSKLTRLLWRRWLAEYDKSRGQVSLFGPDKPKAKRKR